MVRLADGAGLGAVVESGRPRDRLGGLQVAHSFQRGGRATAASEIVIGPHLTTRDASSASGSLRAITISVVVGLVGTESIRSGHVRIG